MSRVCLSLASAFLLALGCNSSDGGGGAGDPGASQPGAMTNPGGPGSDAIGGPAQPGAGNAGGAAGAGSAAANDGGANPLPGGDGVGDTVGNAPGDDGPDTMMGDCGVPSLQLDGLMYSPGGDVLPFGCEPFHPTHNNPYAVKCVDAWPWYDTGFPGDDYCILPPPPDKGMQVGYHPQGMQWHAQVSAGDLSGYASPSDPWLMSPGQEDESNFTSSSPNQQPGSYYRSYVRMRAGSHHMIVSANDPSPFRETWGIAAPVGLFAGEGVPGAQRPDENFPQTLERPEEDAGLYRNIGADRDIIFNNHHFNASDQQTLKEAWINLWWSEDRTTEIHGIFGMPITEAFATFAQPGQTVDKHYSWRFSQDVRLLQVFGHRHAWTPNFSAWVEKSDGSQELIYQSFDWFDQPSYRYDSQTNNPAPAPDVRADGATSGIRILKAGEELHFNCHMAFTPERATAEGAPMPSEVGPLRFANEAFTGEMCILFGNTAAIDIGNPVADSGPVPDFAKLE